MYQQIRICGHVYIVPLLLTCVRHMLMYSLHPTHSCGVNVLCVSIFLTSFIGSEPMITSLNFLNADPCSGFVRKSATIALVGHYSTQTSPLEILSEIKKYLTLICLVRLVLDASLKEHCAAVILEYDIIIHLITLCLQEVSHP